MASDRSWADCGSRTNALCRRLNELRTGSACAPPVRSRPGRLQLALSTCSVKQAVSQSRPASAFPGSGVRRRIHVQSAFSSTSAERENKQRTQAGLIFPFWACDAFEAERVERVWECFFAGTFAAFSEDFFVVGGGAGSPFPRIMDPNSRSVRALAYARAWRSGNCFTDLFNVRNISYWLLLEFEKALHLSPIERSDE
jgi:hypothetical protein